MKFSAGDTAKLLAMAGLPGGKVVTPKDPAGGRTAFQLADPAPSRSERFEVAIPGWHPTLLNKLLGHHRRAGRLKASDAGIVGVSMFRAGVTKAAGKRLVRLHIVLGKGGRGGDPDAYWKSTLDALVNCGALVDDSRRWCEYAPLTDDDFSRAAEKATRITIEDI